MSLKVNIYSFLTWFDYIKIFELSFKLPDFSKLKKLFPNKSQAESHNVLLKWILKYLIANRVFSCD